MSHLTWGLYRHTYIYIYIYIYIHTYIHTVPCGLITCLMTTATYVSSRRRFMLANRPLREAVAVRVLPDMWQYMFMCISHMTSSSFIYDLPRRLLPLHCRHVLVSCTDLFPLYKICVGNLAEIPALIMRSLRRSCPGARRILTIHAYRHYASTFSSHVFSTP